MKSRWIMPLPDTLRPHVEGSSEFSLEGETSISHARATIALSTFELGGAAGKEKILLDGEVEFELGGECGRCLEPATTRVAARFASLIDLGEGTIASRDMETAPEPGGFARVGDSEIDLTDEIRQQVFLAVPLTILCAESCRGLCLQCGGNLNSGACTCPPGGGSGHFDKLADLLDV